MRTRFFLVVLVTLCQLVAPRAALAAEPTFLEDQVLPAPSPRHNGYLGSPAVDGATAIAGAYGANEAHRMNFDGNWNIDGQFTPTPLPANSFFGAQTDVEGDTAVVGAQNDNSSGSGAGSVFIFRRTGNMWVQEQKISSPAGAGGAFGASLDLSGDSLAVGAPLARRAYVYHRSGSTWTRQRTFSSPVSTGEYGWVALDGNTLFVGNHVWQSGRVWVHERVGTTWNLSQTLSPTADTSQFGRTLALDGERAVIGAHTDREGAGVGAVYIYDRDQGGVWQLQQKIRRPDGSHFGLTLDVSGDLLVATNANETVGGAPDAGALYVYRFNGSTWTSIGRLHARSPQFGGALSFPRIGRDVILAGSPGWDVGGVADAGAIFVFDLHEILDQSVPRPDTSIIIHPPSITNVAEAMFTFDSPDDVDGFECSIDEGTFVGCESPQTFTVAEGSHGFSVRSRDVYGRVDLTPATESWLVDLTPPTTTADVPAGWSQASVSVQLVATDALAGVDETFHSLDGGAYVAGDQVEVTGEGEHTLSFYSSDLAGNVEQASQAVVRIDSVPPTITATVTPPPNADGWHNSPPRIEFDCSDTGSGITSCSAPRTMSTEGSGQIVSGSATDNAGNTASIGVEIDLDRTQPLVAINESPLVVGSLTGLARDSLSGVNAIEVVYTDLQGNESSFVAECPGCSVPSESPWPWTAPVPDLPGLYRVRATAWDVADNSSWTQSISTMVFVPVPGL